MAKSHNSTKKSKMIEKKLKAIKNMAKSAKIVESYKSKKLWLKKEAKFV